MQKIIKKLMKKSLSDSEMFNYLGGKTKIIKYPDLSKFNDIDELLEPYGNVIILYLTGQNYGHWTCLFKIDNKNIEFFDPYAFKPDEELKLIPVHFRKENNQFTPHLSHLLYNCNYTIHYNDYKLQQFAKDTNTCGRHCLVRLLFKKMFIDDYAKMMMNQKISPDYIVSCITSIV